MEIDILVEYIDYLVPLLEQEGPSLRKRRGVLNLGNFGILSKFKVLRIILIIDLTQNKPSSAEGSLQRLSSMGRLIRPDQANYWTLIELRSRPGSAMALF